MLPTLKYIALISLYFMNAYMSSFTANNSRILMWYFISRADHILSVDIPSQIVPQPIAETSICMRTCVVG